MKRRGFIKDIAAISATAALPRFSYGQIKGADRVKVGLSGCGSRGCGAVANMLNIDGNVQIVGVADLFQDKIDSAVNRISDFAQKKYGSAAKNIIEPEKIKKFAGWDSLDQMLKEDVDVIIEATPPVFRVSHFEKIVAAGKHAFLEKPACIDAVQARKMYMLADEATRKGLSVVTGNQRRYHEGYRDVIKRVQDGAIGELMSAQCYWNSPSGYYGQNFHDDMEKAGLLKGLSPDDMEYQIRNWYMFIWTSGDHIVEQHVHNLDVIMWALGDNRFPIEVRGWGGRGTDLPVPAYGNHLSHFAVDFDMGDGLRLASYCQQEPKTSPEVGERILGTKGTMETAGNSVRITHKGKVLYTAPTDIPQAYEMEHKILLDSVRNGQRINTLKSLINSTLLGIAGRMSTYSGQKFKFGWVLAKSEENLMPKELKFGKHAVAEVPVPGKNKLI